MLDNEERLRYCRIDLSALNKTKRQMRRINRQVTLPCGKGIAASVVIYNMALELDKAKLINFISSSRQNQTRIVANERGMCAALDKMTLWVIFFYSSDQP